MTFRPSQLPPFAPCYEWVKFKKIYMHGLILTCQFKFYLQYVFEVPATCQRSTFFFFFFFFFCRITTKPALTQKNKKIKEKNPLKYSCTFFKS